MPEARPLPFGHLGDGNIHFNVSQPLGMDKQAFLDRWQDINAIVNEVVLKHGGSISAEHGIGRLKRDAMRKIKSPVELQMMRDLKRLFDPLNILNPGKVLPE
jgi:FAD/FMN-containing dehydrogenase